MPSLCLFFCVFFSLRGQMSTIIHSLGLIFFDTWFTDFFFKIIRLEEGKK